MSNSDRPPHDDHAFGSQWWEQHYQGTEPGGSEPSPHLVSELVDLPVGTALDAGCGTGADAVWLARQGWEVTALDVSPTVVGHAQRLATEEAPEVVGRLSWVVADLTEWRRPRQFDLVVSQYVHPDEPFAAFVARLADSVAPGGTLFVAGHDHADTHSAAHAPEDAAIGADDVVSALSTDVWEVDVAETRTRQVTRGVTELTMHDLVVRAHRKASR